MDSYEFVDGVPKKLILSDKVDPCKVKGAELGVYDLVMCGGGEDVDHKPDSFIYDAPSVYYELGKREKIGKMYPWGSCPLLTVGKQFFTSGEVATPVSAPNTWSSVPSHIVLLVARLWHGIPQEQPVFSGLFHCDRKGRCQRYHLGARKLVQRDVRQLWLPRGGSSSGNIRIG